MEKVKEIANAVLYEGYLLYPYRPSAIKNRQRWNIGVVYPREYSEVNGNTEPWLMRTECLVQGQGDGQATLDISLRFLHLLLRTVAQPVTAQAQEAAPQASEWGLASRLALEPVQEGIEREIKLVDLSIEKLLREPQLVALHFPAHRIVDEDAVREQRPVEGSVRVSAEVVGDELYKLCVQVENTTPETGFDVSRHNEVLLQGFISTHTILQVRQGAFVSLLETPDALADVAKACQNVRTWPVLIGDEGEKDTLLSSPIILYDYPQIAPESPGALFDGTEIDEILTLRILTLSDDEKAEIRRGDPRGREILERTEAMTPEDFMKLHGTIRSMRPIDELDEGV